MSKPARNSGSRVVGLEMLMKTMPIAATTTERTTTSTQRHWVGVGIARQHIPNFGD